MKVYAIIIDDRHSDTDVEVYADRERAIERARALAKEYCRREEDYQELQIADWVFHAEYSCESDSITVLEKELQ